MILLCALFYREREYVLADKHISVFVRLKHSVDFHSYAHTRQHTRALRWRPHLFMVGVSYVLLSGGRICGRIWRALMPVSSLQSLERTVASVSAQHQDTLPCVFLLLKVSPLVSVSFSLCFLSVSASCCYSFVSACHLS